MAQQASREIIIRNEFYRQSMRKMQVLNLCLISLFILLISFYSYLGKTSNSNPHYFPTTPDGKIIPTPALNINHLKLSDQKISPITNNIIGMPPPAKTYNTLALFGENALVLHWVEIAFNTVFSLDFVHYRKTIQEAHRFFTTNGHRRFVEALVNSRNLETVREKQAVVVPQITGKIEIVGTKFVQNRFVWDLKIPFKLTFENVKEEDPTILNLVSYVSIVRVSTLRSPFYGLGIYKINFKEV